MSDPAKTAAADNAPGASAKRRNEAVARQRLAARLAAVQALYQIEATGDAPQKVITQFLSERLEEEIDGLSLAKADRKLFGQLVLAVSGANEELDEILRPYLPSEWVLDRVEPLLHAILRAAAFELRSSAKVPAKVAIAQYVAVTEAFHDPQETGFVNKLLDRLARSLRPAEFAKLAG